MSAPRGSGLSKQGRLPRTRTRSVAVDRMRHMLTRQAGSPPEPQPPVPTPGARRVHSIRWLTTARRWRHLSAGTLIGLLGQPVRLTTVLVCGHPA
jgi:hypothetical protein